MATKFVGAFPNRLRRSVGAALLLGAGLFILAAAPAAASVTVADYASAPGSGYEVAFTLTYDDALPYAQDASIYSISNFSLALPGVSFTSAGVRNLSPGLISIEQPCGAFLATCFDFWFDPAAQSQGRTIGYRILGIGASQAGFINRVSSVTTGVPEPATWLMMLVGFGTIGWSMRRTRRTSLRRQAASGREVLARQP